MSKLAIMAGAGDLPKKVIQACKKENRDYIVVGFKGQTDPALTPHIFPMGAAGVIIDFLKEQRVHQIVFAGAIKRPSLKTIKPDWRGAKMLAKIGMKALGDDGLLSFISHELEKEGFTMIGAQEIIGSLLAPRGIISQKEPDEQAFHDINQGKKVLSQLSSLDIGQSVVVQQGIVLAIEAIEGTDAMLQRAGNLKREGDKPILIKIKKEKQSDKVDLPTIGPMTVENSYKAGLQGIAFSAQNSLLLDREQTVALANKYGLFLVGIESDV